MAPQLLPASAAAFAPRATHVNVVLGPKVETWLTHILKRIIRSRRPLNSVVKLQRCLTELLSSKTAVWNLTSLMVLRVPDNKLYRDPNPLIEALLNYRIIHLEAYIVHVDMVLENEVAFKLTSQSIEALIEYHREVYSVNISSSISSWPEMSTQIEELHKDFIHSINKFVYRTHVSVLEGLYEDGAGELLSEESEEIKMHILNLFRSVKQPPWIKEKINTEVINSNCGSQQNTVPYVSEMREKETQILLSPITISSNNSIAACCHIELQNSEQRSLISSLNQPQLFNEILFSSSQSTYLAPNLYTQLGIVEQSYLFNPGYNIQACDPNFNWI